LNIAVDTRILLCLDYDHLVMVGWRWSREWRWW